MRLNAEARAELEWWWQVGVRWNGVSMMTSLMVTEQPQVELVTDASGLWGCVWHQVAATSRAGDGRLWAVGLCVAPSGSHK